jgi:hypothetical protein
MYLRDITLATMNKYFSMNQIFSLLTKFQNILRHTDQSIKCFNDVFIDS